MSGPHVAGIEQFAGGDRHGDVRIRAELAYRVVQPGRSPVTLVKALLQGGELRTLGAGRMHLRDRPWHRLLWIPVSNGPTSTVGASKHEAATHLRLWR